MDRESFCRAASSCLAQRSMSRTGANTRPSGELGQDHPDLHDSLKSEAYNYNDRATGGYVAAPDQKAAPLLRNSS